DALALAGVTDQIVYLEEGDVVDVHATGFQAFDGADRPVTHPVHTVPAMGGAVELGPYRHYMQKEIFEQPRAVADTLGGIEAVGASLFAGSSGASTEDAQRILEDTRSVLILACGTSYYAG